MSSTEARRERLRFEALHQEMYPDGHRLVLVELEWSDGVRFMGEAEGAATLEGGLRAGAEAVLAAANEASGGELTLTLRGVKAVKAFDSWVVVVSVHGETEEKRYRLLGAYPCPDEDTVKGAAMAVLDATNRVLTRFVTEE